MGSKKPMTTGVFAPLPPFFPLFSESRTDKREETRVARASQRENSEQGEPVGGHCGPSHTRERGGGEGGEMHLGVTSASITGRERRWRVIFHLVYSGKTTWKEQTRINCVCVCVIDARFSSRPRNSWEKKEKSNSRTTV